MKKDRIKIFRKVNGLTMSQWIKEETRRRKVKMWGEYSFIQPVLHPKKFGDGLQLAYMGTIDQRPHYWLIRVDSRLDLSADGFDYEKHLLEPLEDEFGRAPDTWVSNAKEFNKLKKQGHLEIDEYDNYKQYTNCTKYPNIAWTMGGHWGTVVNFGNGDY